MSLPPGSTIGIIGGGQLGRMMAMAAARLGFECHIFDPHEAPCAAEVSARFTRAAFNDEAALVAFATECDVVTYEFENVPVGPLAALQDKLRPGIRSLEMAQDRAVEKEFLESTGANVATWRRIDTGSDARAAQEALGLPLVMKSRRLGYDGKGQAWATDGGSAVEAFSEIGGVSAVAEAAVSFDAEFSIIVARATDGSTAIYDAPLNRHEGGILRFSSVPAGAQVVKHEAQARKVATDIAEALGHVGVLTVEFFATANGPLVNEFAPRVHNSGHWTIEGAMTSQFEQHVRAIAGLPLGDTGLVTGTASMQNLIGKDVDKWATYLAEPGAFLHLYNKGEARHGRKMGHVTRLR